MNTLYDWFLGYLSDWNRYRLIQFGFKSQYDESYTEDSCNE